MLKAVIVIFALGLAGAQASKCTEEYEAVLDVHKTDAGGGLSFPQCHADGSYRSKQCIPATRQCFCVDQNGTRISDYSMGELFCPCLVQRAAAEASKLHGTFVPRCTREGRYELMQCYGIIGECWCVDQTTGKKISPGTGNLQRCDCLQQRFDEQKDPLSTTPPIQCFENGDYKPIQNNNGRVWCSDGDGLPITNVSSHLRSCQCLLHQHKIHKEDLRKIFIPQCDSNGDYAPLQCHEFKDGSKICWCVRPDGIKIVTPKATEKLCICLRNADKLKGLALSISFPACY